MDTKVRKQQLQGQMYPAYFTKQVIKNVPNYNRFNFIWVKTSKNQTGKFKI